jgi:hypothetical protein
MLWMCNVGNLVLAMGLFLEKSVLVRLAAIWTVPGLVIWFLYVVLAWGVFLTSTLAHVGGLAVAIIALSKYRIDRTAWRWAFGWYLAIQPGWEQAFGSYWTFWLTLTLVAIVTLWLSGLLLWSIWPADVREELAV